MKPHESFSTSGQSEYLRARLVAISPVRDLAVVRVAVGLLIVVVGLGAWIFGKGSEEPPPEEALPRATATPSDGVAPEKSKTTELIVQAGGSVNSPGVVRVPEGGRVTDVVDAAGGLRDDADVDRINLAAKVMDGERIYIVAKGEQGAPTIAGAGSESVDSGDGSSMVNINTASEKTLEELPGVGPSTAKAIVDHREKAGPFKAVKDLSAVKGIGPAKLEQIEPMARV